MTQYVLHYWHKGLQYHHDHSILPLEKQQVLHPVPDIQAETLISLEKSANSGTHAYKVTFLAVPECWVILKLVYRAHSIQTHAQV